MARSGMGAAKSGSWRVRGCWYAYWHGNFVCVNPFHLQSTFKNKARGCPTFRSSSCRASTASASALLGAPSLAMACRISGALMAAAGEGPKTKPGWESRGATERRATPRRRESTLTHTCPRARGLQGRVALARELLLQDALEASMHESTPQPPTHPRPWRLYRARKRTREAGAEDLLLARHPVHPLDCVVHHLCGVGGVGWEGGMCVYVCVWVGGVVVVVVVGWGWGGRGGAGRVGTREVSSQHGTAIKQVSCQTAPAGLAPGDPQVHTRAAPPIRLREWAPPPTNTPHHHTHTQHRHHQHAPPLPQPQPPHQSRCSPLLCRSPARAPGSRSPWPRPAWARHTQPRCSCAGFGGLTISLKVLDLCASQSTGQVWYQAHTPLDTHPDSPGETLPVVPPRSAGLVGTGQPAWQRTCRWRHTRALGLASALRVGASNRVAGSTFSHDWYSAEGGKAGRHRWGGQEAG